MKPVTEEKWTVDEDYEDDKQRVIAICGEQGYICGIHIDKEDNPRLQFSQEDRGRARLIAAAPAMLKALEDLLYEPMAERTVDQAKRAIREAKQS